MGGIVKDAGLTVNEFPRDALSFEKLLLFFAPRLDPLDHLRQAGRDARAPDQKCLLDACCWETTRLLLRPLRVL